jgi:hypothetical protein
MGQDLPNAAKSSTKFSPAIQLEETKKAAGVG